MISSIYHYLRLTRIRLLKRSVVSILLVLFVPYFLFIANQPADYSSSWSAKDEDEADFGIDVTKSSVWTDYTIWNRTKHESSLSPIERRLIREFMATFPNSTWCIEAPTMNNGNSIPIPNSNSKRIETESNSKRTNGMEIEMELESNSKRRNRIEMDPNSNSKRPNQIEPKSNSNSKWNPNRNVIGFKSNSKRTDQIEMEFQSNSNGMEIESKSNSKRMDQIEIGPNSNLERSSRMEIDPKSNGIEIESKPNRMEIAKSNRIEMAPKSNSNSNETDRWNFSISPNRRGNSNRIRLGGWWKPTNCIARHTTAVVIPYRDRDQHLRKLLHRLHRVMQNQLISYRIFVVEQNGTTLFNKGALLNIAFLTITEQYSTYASDCVIFHDVDLIPEDERNLYTCPDPKLMAVRHLSPEVDKFKYKIPYPELVGGVFAISPDLLRRVNGYSNLYYGWGGEDDDMYYRLESEEIQILRPPLKIGRYKMLSHLGRPVARNRYRLLRGTRGRYKTDGLSNILPVSFYNIVSIQEMPHYTHILVALNSSHTKSCLVHWCWLFFACFFFLRAFCFH